MTAGEIVARIKARLGVAWRESTYRDTFKAGGPDIAPMIWGAIERRRA